MKKAIVWFMVIMMSVGLLAGCGEKEKESETEAEVTIVGTWEYKAMECAYSFNEDETGAYIFGGVEMPFTYTDDGTAVSILYEGNTSPNVLKYTIDGNTLSIEDSFGDMVEYEKSMK